MRGTIVKIAEHLGKTLSEEQISQLEEHMNINSFKKNKAVNHEFLKTSGDIKCDFVRKGKQYFNTLPPPPLFFQLNVAKELLIS